MAYREECRSEVMEEIELEKSRETEFTQLEEFLAENGVEENADDIGAENGAEG